MHANMSSGARKAVAAAICQCIEGDTKEGHGDTITKRTSRRTK
jgi:hypothetical protein